MKFGKNKTFTQKKNNIIKVNKDGTGEEIHPYIKKNKDVIEVPPDNEINLYPNQTIMTYDDIFKEKIVDLVHKKIKGEELLEKKEEKEKDSKLYLNNFINILNNILRKVDTTIKKKIVVPLTNWWRKETTEDIKDLVKFVTIHGAIGAPTLLMLLTVTNVNIKLLQIIRTSIPLTLLVYAIGTGSGLYLFFDINQELYKSWGRKRRK